MGGCHLRQGDGQCVLGALGSSSGQTPATGRGSGSWRQGSGHGSPLQWWVSSLGDVVGLEVENAQVACSWGPVLSAPWQ